jgi:putative heme iron utilization protein
MAHVRDAFLASHPEASHYVNFADFHFYRLEPITLRYVGGFGRMSFVNVAEYFAAEPDPLRDAASGILAHMNEDHADAVLAYAHAFATIPSATSAVMTAVDRYGFELQASTPDGPKVARIAFDAPVSTSNEVRKAMVALVARARALGTP